MPLFCEKLKPEPLVLLSKKSDKAEALKKNLEGTKLNFKNSFLVLDNNELLVRSSKMKLIEWYSGSFDSDGSHLVSNKKSMKKKNNTRKSALKPELFFPNMLMGKHPLKEMIIRLPLCIISRKVK